MLVSITTLATYMHPQGGEHWQMCGQALVTMVLPLPLRYLALLPQVVGVLRHKYLFKTRPRALISKPTGRQ
jgi:hypothetical protein